MVRNALTLWAVVAIVVAAMGAAVFLLPRTTGASEHTATRTLPESPVAAGGEFTVAINTDNIGSFGNVEETLPAGFTYVSSSGLPDSQVRQAGQVVTFTLFGETSFTYTVTASDMAGDYEITGTVRDSYRDDRDVGGDSTVTVEAGAPAPTFPTEEPDATEEPEGANASRSLSSSSVLEGGEVTVTINASEYGGIGRVIETLPAGFTYVTSSLSASQDGQELTFALIGEESFTYTVTASDTEGDYSFTGMLIDIDKNEVDVGGDADITVESEFTMGARRSFSSSSVNREDDFTVTIDARGYGSIGRVKETLPAGFAFVSSDLSASQDGQELTFALIGEESFTYTVTASSVAGGYSFSGTLSDIDKNETDVGGESDITVTTDAIHSGSRSFSSTSVTPGGTIGVTITASKYGAAGRVMETLPEGFAYVESTLSASQDGQELTFVLLGETEFSYSATAPTTTGVYTFSGVLSNIDRENVQIGGDTDLSVRTRRPSVSVPVVPAQQPPRFFLGESAKLEIRENSALGTPVGDPIQAQDNRKRPITYGIAGDAPFTIDAETGQIAVGEGAELDYESARRSYTFDVTATSEGGTGSINITVVVTNVDEAGSITVSPGTPVIGTTLTATLTDPDGGVKDVVWQWQRSRDGVTWNNISEATSDSYTARAADAGMRLRAMATYADARLSGLSVSSSGTAAVPVPPTPTPPPTATATPPPPATPTPRPTATAPPPPTATPVPTATATPVPTATPAPTATLAPTPTAVPTATTVPPPEPTATTAPTPRPTATAAPTATPRPTPEPPPAATATPAPTITPTPEPPEEDGGFPIWAIVLIIIVAVAAAGGIAFVVRQRMQQQDL